MFSHSQTPHDTSFSKLQHALSITTKEYLWFYMCTLMFTILVFLPSISIIAWAPMTFSLSVQTPWHENNANRPKRKNSQKQTSRCQNKSHSTFGWRVSLSQPPSQKPLYSSTILERTENTAAFKQAWATMRLTTLKTLHRANCKGSQKLEIFAVGESSKSVQILGHPFHCNVT